MGTWWEHIGHIKIQNIQINVGQLFWFFKESLVLGISKKIEIQESIGSRYLKKIESKNQWF
jgi:hypothetical protein